MRDTVRGIKRMMMMMMMMMTGSLNDSFNPFLLFLITHLYFVYFICLCFWCFCASWLFVWNGSFWLWERAAVIACLLLCMGCNLAHRWPSFSWPEEETHAAVIFSFQCFFGEHARMCTEVQKSETTLKMCLFFFHFYWK